MSVIKVSVIIPVYNVENYLPDCLDSVLSQTLKEIEVICIEDASPDNCGKILDEYEERDPRMKVLHLAENHQQGYGRNRGLEMAAGKYVYFLDSDDMITPDAMEKLYDLSEKDGLDGVFFDSQVVFESENLRKKGAWYEPCRNGTYEDRVYSGRELYDAFISQGDWTVFIQRQFWRREYLVDAGVSSPEGTEHEDEFFAFKAILLAEKVRYVPERFFIHRFRDNSVMTRPKDARDFHGYFRNYYLMVEMTSQYQISGETIDRNISHMYEWMVLTFPLFSAGQDQKIWFTTEEEQELYRFFAASQKSEFIFARRIRRLLSEITPYQSIWIYGAGAYGNRVYHALTDLGCRIDGFLVTSKADNPDRFFGLPVRSVDEIDPSDKNIAIVAVSGAYRAEVVQKLEEKSWNYTIYNHGSK